MSDLLDDLLDTSETLRNPLHHHYPCNPDLQPHPCAAPPKPPHNAFSSLSISVSPLHHLSYVPPTAAPFAPSPRAVQDITSPFTNPLPLHQPPPHHSPLNSLPPPPPPSAPDCPDPRSLFGPSEILPPVPHHAHENSLSRHSYPALTLTGPCDVDAAHNLVDHAHAHAHAEYHQVPDHASNHADPGLPFQPPTHASHDFGMSGANGAFAMSPYSPMPGAAHPPCTLPDDSMDAYPSTAAALSASMPTEQDQRIKVETPSDLAVAAWPTSVPSPQPSASHSSSGSVATKRAAQDAGLMDDMRDVKMVKRETSSLLSGQSADDFDMADGDATTATTSSSGATNKTSATASVMQPSAKSILERREKAMREGRRKDAKLSEVERRIVRRLRNRESAERCRLRRLRQTELMKTRFENMKTENERLLEEAEEYKRRIAHYESIIEGYSKRVTGMDGTADNDP